MGQMIILGRSFKHPMGSSAYVTTFTYYYKLFNRAWCFVCCLVGQVLGLYFIMCIFGGLWFIDMLD